MNIAPEYRKAVARWGHTGEGETVEMHIVAPIDTIEFNLEFDSAAMQKLFKDYPELIKQKHDGP